MSLRYVAFLLLATFATVSNAVGTEPESIEIVSQWTGFGTPQESRVTFVRRNGKYMAGRKAVRAKAVDDLLSAIAEPFVAKLSLGACGDQWLNDNYKAALEQQTHRKLDRLSPDQVESFRSRFTDRHNAESVFLEPFKYSYSDTYPDVSVILRSGGKEYGVRSRSQHPFMLPWDGVEGPAGGYNCKISEAVADLVGRKFSNRSLFAGEEFREALAGEVMAAIKHDWDLLDTKHK